MSYSRAGPIARARRALLILPLAAVVLLPSVVPAQDQICITTRTETVTVYRIFGVEVWRTVTVTSETECSPA